MRELEQQIRKQGFTYTQVERSESTAIYSQVCNDSGRLVAYEVFRINKNKEREQFGTTIAASESMPNNEQFGKTAWVYAVNNVAPGRALQKARVKFTELELKEELRLKQQEVE